MRRLLPYIPFIYDGSSYPNVSSSFTGHFPFCSLHGDSSICWFLVRLWGVSSQYVLLFSNMTPLILEFHWGFNLLVILKRTSLFLMLLMLTHTNFNFSSLVRLLQFGDLLYPLNGSPFGDLSEDYSQFTLIPLCSHYLQRLRLFCSINGGLEDSSICVFERTPLFLLFLMLPHSNINFSSLGGLLPYGDLPPCVVL